MYFAFKNSKLAVKEVNGIHKAERKFRMKFFEVKMQQDSYRWCNYKLNCQEITYLKASKQQRSYRATYSEVSNEKKS